jgi:hypothetical protein
LQESGLLDFRVFLYQVWSFLNLPDPTPVQRDIGYNLQHAPSRFILQAFRGVGKSWITVAFVLWQLLLDPQKKIMVVSASQTLADDFSKFCKQLLHGMPMLQHLAPREGQRDSAISFDVGPASPSKDPSVKSVGITGQLTGSRADIIVADDIEVPKNSYTHLLRERLADLVKEFDAVLKPDGRVIYLGTPQIEASLYNRLAKDRGYTIRIWRVEVPADIDRYQGRLAPFAIRAIERGTPAGTPLEPTRFPEADLRKRRMSYGEAGYALQFMLDTSPSDIDRHPLKLSDLIIADVDADMAPVKTVWGRDRQHQVTDLPAGGLEGDCYYSAVWRSPEMASFTGTVLAVDPSGMGADETSYAIVKNLHGQLYLVASGGFKDGFSEVTLGKIAATAALHKVTDVVVEENYGGGMFGALLAPHLAKYNIGRINADWNGWSRGQKELRVCDTLEPIFKSHRLTIDRRVIEEDVKQQHESERYSLVQQITRMARVKGALPNDDRVEALSMACAYWTERLARDQDKQLKSHRDDLLDMELKKFMEGFGGSPINQYRYAKRRD